MECSLPARPFLRLDLAVDCTMTMLEVHLCRLFVNLAVQPSIPTSLPQFGIAHYPNQRSSCVALFVLQAKEQALYEYKHVYNHKALQATCISLSYLRRALLNGLIEHVCSRSRFQYELSSSYSARPERYAWELAVSHQVQESK